MKDTESKIYCLKISRTMYDVFTVKAPSLSEAAHYLRESCDAEGILLDGITDYRVDIANGADPETGEANEHQIRSCEHFGKYFDMTELE